jgi:hypothetical protein
MEEVLGWMERLDGATALYYYSDYDRRILEFHHACMANLWQQEEPLPATQRGVLQHHPIRAPSG